MGLYADETKWFTKRSLTRCPETYGVRKDWDPSAKRRTNSQVIDDYKVN